jgi:hypothetical protein
MSTSSAARQFVTWAPLAAVLIVLLPVVATAQEPVTSFDQLNTRLKVGDTVWVTDAQGREIKGRIRGLSATSLLLDAGGSPQDLQAARVGTIRVQQSDSLKNGALIGLAAGAVAGALVMVAVCEGEAGCAPGGALLGAGAGAGIGVGIDAARGGKKVLAYRAPGASGSARLSLAPLITPHTKGVALSYSF